jgi:hypothetical protein
MASVPLKRSAFHSSFFISRVPLVRASIGESVSSLAFSKRPELFAFFHRMERALRSRGPGRISPLFPRRKFPIQTEPNATNNNFD